MAINLSGNCTVDLRLAKCTDEYPQGNGMKLANQEEQEF
jgi:hypothetical protein